MTMMPAWLLLRQWGAGQPVWSWRTGGNEHHIQCMAFEMLRWFLNRPRGGERRLVVGEEFVSPLMRRLEALPGASSAIAKGMRRKTSI